MSLPPPEHEDHVDARFKRHNCYTAEQMQAYGQQCRDQALLEAAALCNGEQWMMSGKKSVDYIAAFNEGCADCEAVIRRLK